MNEISNDFEKLLTKNELSEALNVSVSLINKLCKNEDFPKIKIGKAIRFNLKDVMKWIEEKSK